MHDDALHPPAEPEPTRVLPRGPEMARGVGLAALMVVAVLGARTLVRASAWLAPLSLALAAAAMLAAWGAAVQFTGGEKVDDHPFV